MPRLGPFHLPYVGTGNGKRRKRAAQTKFRKNRKRTITSKRRGY